MTDKASTSAVVCLLLSLSLLPPDLAAAQQTIQAEQDEALELVEAALAEHQVKVLKQANTTRFAYVLTGDADVDQRSRQGMSGISRILTQRTAFEPGEPFSVDPLSDELAFYPLIYWPMPSAPVRKPVMGRPGWKGSEAMAGSQNTSIRLPPGSLKEISCPTSR